MTSLPRRYFLAGVAACGALAAWPLKAQSLPGNLEALRNAVPTDGSPLFVRGARSVGDGGEGWFVWRADSDTADDGGCVIAPDSQKTGRWHRLYSGPVDVQWFGARGDGVADDAAAIQSALDHHAEVHLPAGVYRLSRPLDMTRNWGRRLSGAGQTADPRSPGGFDQGRLSRASTLLLDADNAPVLRLAGSGHLIERLHLATQNPQPASARKSYGLELNNVSRARFTDLRIFNCATGIGIPQRPDGPQGKANVLFDSAFVNVDVNAFSACGFDLRNYDGGGTGVVLSQIYLNNSRDGKVGGDVGKSEHFILGQNWAEYALTAVHCEWSHCLSAPIRLHNCNVAIDGLHFEGVRFDAKAPAVIALEGGSAGCNLTTAQFYDCEILGNGPPLPVVRTTAKIARARLSGVRFAPSLRAANRGMTIGDVAGGDGRIAASGVIAESPAYRAPRASRTVVVTE